MLAASSIFLHTFIPHLAFQWIWKKQTNKHHLMQYFNGCSHFKAQLYVKHWHEFSGWATSEDLNSWYQWLCPTNLDFFQTSDVLLTDCLKNAVYKTVLNGGYLGCCINCSKEKAMPMKQQFCHVSPICVLSLGEIRVCHHAIKTDYKTYITVGWTRASTGRWTSGTSYPSVTLCRK